MISTESQPMSCISQLNEYTQKFHCDPPLYMAEKRGAGFVCGVRFIAPDRTIIHARTDVVVPSKQEAKEAAARNALDIKKCLESAAQKPTIDKPMAALTQIKFRGEIQLIIGPMFSGKTTELMRRVGKYEIAGKSCLLVRNSKDNRYSIDSNTLTTCNGLSKSALHFDILPNATHFEHYDVIGVDEGQFFEDDPLGNYQGVYSLCKALADEGKVVIVSALNGTFDQTPWPEISKLIPEATDITYMNAVCKGCTTSHLLTPAPYSHLYGPHPQNGVVSIGGLEKYQALCRTCLHTNPSQM